jgi:type IV pilus assembly protein PilM
VVQALKNLIKRLGIGGFRRKAAISMGGASVLIKRVTTEASHDKAELAERVYYEAEQHFQHDISELYYHPYILDSLDQNGGQPVLLAGAKREAVDQTVDVIKTIGMNVAVVDCDVFATANMFEFSYGIHPNLIAIVNIGAAVTQVSLIGRGQYLYTRDIPIGGFAYTNRIKKDLGIDSASAESLKIAASMGDQLNANKISHVLRAVNDQLASEVKVTLDYYLQSGEAPEGFKSVEHIFLCGGGARTLGLDAALLAGLQKKVSIVNPFQKIEVNSRKMNRNDVHGHGSVFAVSVGLALRQANDDIHGK